MLRRRLVRASAEIGFIVAGILIAFSIDRWWSAVERRELERDYIVRLAADVAATRTELAEAAAHEGSMLAAGRAALRLMARAEAAPITDSLPALLSAVFNAGPVRLQMATYDELRTSGNLHLIRNDPLRQALANFDAYVREAFATTQQVWMQEWLGRVRPYVEPNAIPEVYFTPEQMRSHQVPAFPGRFDMMNLARDRELWNLVVQRLIVADASQRTFEEGARLAGELAAMLEPRR